MVQKKNLKANLERLHLLLGTDQNNTLRVGGVLYNKLQLSETPRNKNW